MDDAAAIRKAIQLLARRHRVQRRAPKSGDDLSESMLQMLRLHDLLLRPFQVVPQHRNSVLVDAALVGLAVAVVACDPLEAAGKVDDRAPELPVIVFETL